MPVDNPSIALGLPVEILLLVFDFLDLPVRAWVVHLSKLYNQMLGARLYRDIHLRSALQLVKLYRTKHAARNLLNTRYLTITEHVLDKESWEGIRVRLRPAAYLGRILQMSTSLRELAICELRMGLDSSFKMDFLKEIQSRARYSAFLPLLVGARFQDSLSCSQLLGHGRRIRYMDYGQSSEFIMRYSSLRFYSNHASSSGLSLSIPAFSTSSNLFRNFQEISEFLNTCFTSGFTLKHLMVDFCSLSCSGHTPWKDYRTTLSSWLKVLSSNKASKSLDSLCFVVSPCTWDPSNLSVKELHLVVEECGRLLPDLTHAIVGSQDIEWRRNIQVPTNPSDMLPGWTPCPRCDDPEILSWWLEALGLETPGEMSNEDLKSIAIRLQDAMRNGWDDAFVPSLEKLQARLSCDHCEEEPVIPTFSVCVIQ